MSGHGPVHKRAISLLLVLFSSLQTICMGIKLDASTLSLRGVLPPRRGGNGNGQRAGSRTSGQSTSLSSAAVPKAPESGSKSDSEMARALSGCFLRNMAADNEEARALLLDQLHERHGWTHVATSPEGVTVEKRQMPTGSYVNGEDASAGRKHAGVRSTGVVKAPPLAVFSLFKDNARVREFNEHILTIQDIPGLVPPGLSEGMGRTRWTKLTWSAGPKYGPFKARDFISVVNLEVHGNGTYLVHNRPGYLPHLYPPTDKHQRATVLAAANLIEPVTGPDGEAHTKLTQLAHVNPGGACDTKLGASILNSLCAKSPPAFFRSLEKAAQNTDMSALKQPRKRRFGRFNVPVIKVPVVDVNGLKTSMTSFFEKQRNQGQAVLSHWRRGAHDSKHEWDHKVKSKRFVPVKLPKTRPDKRHHLRERESFMDAARRIDERYRTRRERRGGASSWT